jgi:transposase
MGSSLGGQVAFLPLDVRDVLPKDHLVWEVIDQVAEFDMTPFLAAYRADGVGRPPYHPAVMVALLLYCYRKRCLSLRDIRTACRDDLGVRVILDGKVPSISTLSEFMTTHRDALRGLLPQTLAMADREGLVDLSVVAGDGTKMVANAAMKTTTDQEGLRAQIADLTEQIEATAALWAEQVAAATPTLDSVRPDPFGTLDLDLDDGLLNTGTGLADPSTALAVGRQRPGGSDQNATWRRLGALNRLLACRQEALTWLTGHPPLAATEDWEAQLARDNDRVTRASARVDALQAQLQTAWDTRQAQLAAGNVFRGAPLVPLEANSRLLRERKALATATARAAKTAANRPTAARVNTTDLSSRIMPGKHDGYDQRHNMQALCCPGQLILGVGLHDNANDKRALQPLLQNARTNLDTAGITRPIGTALFDTGYACEANITNDNLPADKVLIAVEKEARQTGRQHDEVSTAAAAWQSMADLLADPANAALYKRRAAIIEPLFAQWFNRFGRGVSTRGDTVETELHLRATAHNLEKISRARRRRARPT